MKKKILSLCLVLALGATAVIGGTLAYFTDTESKDNIVTVGNIDIDLTEPKWESEGKAEAEDLYPGEAVAKDPTVTNLESSANPCFVRLKVDFPEDGNFSYRTNYQDNLLGEGWVEYEGYYYYTGILQPGDTTTALFDQIVLNANVTGETYTEAIHIPVTAEAVQTQGARPSFDAVQVMTVPEIAEWFATCGL